MKNTTDNGSTSTVLPIIVTLVLVFIAAISLMVPATVASAAPIATDAACTVLCSQAVSGSGGNVG